MPSHKLLLIFLFALGIAIEGVAAVSFASGPTDIGLRTIYGEDLRCDQFEVSEHIAVRTISPSTFALVKKNRLQRTSNGWVATYEKLGDRLNLCPNVRFRNDPSLSYCTGVLVGPRTFITAGHCLPSPEECSKTWLVFDYSKQNETGLIRFTDSSVIACGSVQKRILKTDKKTGITIDIAIGSFEGAQGRAGAPLSLPYHFPTKIGLIGFPLGLPMKVDLDGEPFGTSEQSFFANIDAFRGNSGSPVFDTTTGSIVGILMGGEQDWVQKNGCKIPKVCNLMNCQGETVATIHPLLRDIFQK